MTAFDRIERRMPELMDELASAGIPDYFDDMLQQSAQARQRPAWSALERWLPMGVIARPLPTRPMPWRLIALVALIGLLAVASVVYIGAQQKRVPPPFGLAANGALAIGTADGDIVTVDPDTGTTMPLITGPTLDGGPYFSNDGQRFVFDRGPTEAAKALYIANADGTGVRELFPANSVTWFEWVPNSDRGLVVSTVGGKGTVSILNVIDRSSTNISLDLDVAAAAWRPNHEQIVVTSKVGDNVAFWVVNADGSGTPRRIAASDAAINEPTFSPDGTLLAYATWDPATIRVVNIEQGGDHPITTGDGEGDVWQSPQFTPDGTHIAVYRLVAGSDPVVGKLAVIPVDGRGTPIALGPMTGNPMPDVQFSPDGTEILATYPTLSKTFMFDPATGIGHEVPFVATTGSSWQRRAR
jgi:Tol biopolymer transport system component